MAEILYNIIIRPLELFFQFIYGAAYGFIGNYGFSIIILSLAINFLVLPLYRRADAIQTEERDIQNKMAKWIDHIKHTFHGDERYMKLTTYYRQNHYSSVYALRGSISLFLQIPFFIAAYRFLSGYEAIRGVSFGPITDLGAPDGLLHVFGLSLNLLPILMTLINFVSGAIYTRGFPLKTKIQLYGTAVFFLIFLYKSPAGLVFYWTLNNLFSLIKNIFYKLPNPRKVLCFLSAIIGILLWVLEFTIFLQHTSKQRFFILAIGAALVIPILLTTIRRIATKKTNGTPEIMAVHDTISATGTVGNKALYLISCISLSVLLGLLIPSSVIASSPQEFVNGIAPTHPAGLLLRPALISIGFCILWFGVFYSLAKKTTQKTISLIVFMLLIIAVVNYMFFGKNLGNISPDLVFDNEPLYSSFQQVLNILILLLISFGIWLVWKKKRAALQIATVAILIGLVGLSTMNLVKINSSYKEMLHLLSTGDSDNTPSIPLSKNGKNVMLIMLDRAMGVYIPYVMKEKPELMDQFSGFTFYPNTVSFGISTNFGSPALFGGYEYTPEELNRRNGESLAEKHNEALKMLPKLFSDNGYHVTIADPPYAGYQWTPDLSIYDDLDNTHAYRTMGQFNEHHTVTDAKRLERRKRNLFCYSVFKTAPEFLQHFLYNGGLYYSVPDPTIDGEQEEMEAEGDFMDWYTVLTHLPDMTHVSDKEINSFLVFQNSTPHEPKTLQKPQYVPVDNVDNDAYDEEHADDYVIDGKELHMDTARQIRHYHSNMATLIQLGKWFDELKRLGVYNNTRIIIVSDHGKGAEQYDDLMLNELDFDAMWVNPLMMIKDFNANGFETSDAFMTNADAPSFVVKGLFENPQNPYTHKPIDTAAKSNPLKIVYSKKWRIEKNNGNVFDTSDGRWFTVHDNIFDPNNWAEIEEPSF